LLVKVKVSRLNGIPFARLAIFILAWALSALPLFFSSAFDKYLGDASRLALAWTPWVALIGLPAVKVGHRDWPLALGLALPVLGLATGMDLRAELGLGRLEATFGAGLLTVCLLGEARHQAALRGVRAYGPLWFSLIAIMPALSVALAFGSAGRVPVGGVAGKLASISPLSAIWRDVRPIEGGFLREALSSALFCPSTIACLLLFLLVSALGRRSASA
jgi:hypothetical protein